VQKKLSSLSKKARAIAMDRASAAYSFAK
jgi:hypothetical protein